MFVIIFDPRRSTVCAKLSSPQATGVRETPTAVIDQFFRRGVALGVRLQNKKPLVGLVG